MFSALGTILLIVSLVLGGSSATVAAAQVSLPDQMLYPVKTWSEGIRSQFTEKEEARIQLSLNLASRRAEEMQAMLRAGQTPPAAVQNRFQSQIDLALQLAAGQPDQEAVQSMQKIREQLQAHEHVFAALGAPANPQAQAVLDQTRKMLRDRLQQCELGVKDPDALREQLHEQDRDRKQDNAGQAVPPAAPKGVGPAGSRGTTNTPAQGNSYGPGPEGNGSQNPPKADTPAPGSGYGPGEGSGDQNPWTDLTPTPGSGYGPGPGDCDCDEDGTGNPWTTGTPTPGSGYGPGPQPDQPGSGGGDGDGSGGDGGTGPGPGPAGNNPDSGTNGGNPDSSGGSGGGAGGGKGK